MQGWQVQSWCCTSRKAALLSFVVYCLLSVIQGRGVAHMLVTSDFSTAGCSGSNITCPLPHPHVHGGMWQCPTLEPIEVYIHCIERQKFNRLWSLEMEFGKVIRIMWDNWGGGAMIKPQWFSKQSKTDEDSQTLCGILPYGTLGHLETLLGRKSKPGVRPKGSSNFGLWISNPHLFIKLACLKYFILEQNTPPR